jgi:hypothetical protein
MQGCDRLNVTDSTAFANGCQGGGLSVKTSLGSAAKIRVCCFSPKGVGWLLTQMQSAALGERHGMVPMYLAEQPESLVPLLHAHPCNDSAKVCKLLVRLTASNLWDVHRQCVSACRLR